MPNSLKSPNSQLPHIFHRIAKTGGFDWSAPLGWCCILLLLAGCGPLATAHALDIRQLAQTLRIQHGLVHNQAGQACKKQGIEGPCFRGRIALSSPVDLQTTGWSLYFSSPAYIHLDLSDAFNIRHINGDLYQLQPNLNSARTESAQSKPVHPVLSKSENYLYQIDYLGSNWLLSEFDVLPNYYLAYDKGRTAVIASTLAQTDPESGEEWLPHSVGFSDYQRQGKRTENERTAWATPEWQYARNATRVQSLKKVATRIIPAMQQVKNNGGKFVLTSSLQVIDKDWQLSAEDAGLGYLKKAGIDWQLAAGQPESTLSANTSHGLRLQRDSTIQSAEGYRLRIDEASIELSAATKRGLFYGLVSLAALYEPSAQAWPTLEANDQPRFAFRGLHLDVARHFRSKQWVLKLLDQMAAYKLNKLHLHLGDDEGWRLAVTDLPELTDIGARQCHDLTEQRCLIPQLGNGPKAQARRYYSRADYLAILKAAQARHIQVIPSFDMPGHSRASIKAMDVAEKRLVASGQPSLKLSEEADRSNYLSIQYFKDNTLNVCQPSTYRFIEKVVTYLKALHQSAQVPLEVYHIGADETAGAWRDSPACKKLLEAEHITSEQLPGYFLRRVTSLLKKHHIVAAGWSDGMSHMLNDERMPGNQVNVWEPLFWQGQRKANQFANRGWQVVLSFPDVTYFDFPYEADPAERGYYWGARAIDTRKVFEWMPENLPLHAEIWRDRENNPWQVEEVHSPNAEEEKQTLKPGAHFAGIQGHLWGEQIRSDQIAERMLMPRLMALAERAWHKPAWAPAYRYQGGVYNQQSHYFGQQHKQQRELDWQTFVTRLVTRELPSLAQQSWFFRMPTAGARWQKLENGEWQLLMNSSLPGLNLSWREEGGHWQSWDADNPPRFKQRPENTAVRTVLANSQRVSAMRWLRRSGQR